MLIDLEVVKKRVKVLRTLVADTPCAGEIGNKLVVLLEAIKSFDQTRKFQVLLAEVIRPSDD